MDAEKKPLEGLDGSASVPVLQFSKVVYNNFCVEVTLAGKKNEDYVAHFYPPEDAPNGPALKKFWLETFPATLSEVAMSSFSAGPDRLKAAYTEEVASWWFRAYGFAAEGLDPSAKIEKFFAKLDQALATNNLT